jgi:hypothetical protein
MKLPNKNLSILLLSFIFSACCTAPSIYKLTSEEPNTDYLMGDEIITKEIFSVVASLNFEEQFENEFYFYVYIKNNSLNPIIFSPENIFIEIFDEDMEYISAYMDTVYAKDPELAIHTLNSDLHSRTNQHEVVTGLNTVFGLLSIATDIATSPSETKLERVADDIESWTFNQANESIAYSNDMIRLENKKEFWQNEVLRKTTLYTDDKIGGVFLIPVVPKAKFVKLHIILNGRDFVFLYKQVKIKTRFG